MPIDARSTTGAKFRARRSSSSSLSPSASGHRGGPWGTSWSTPYPTIRNPRSATTATVCCEAFQKPTWWPRAEVRNSSISAASEVLLRAERVVENYSRPEEPASRVGDDASAGDEALEVWIEGDREGVGAVAVLQVEELDGAMRQQRSGSSRRQLYYRDEVPSQGSGSYPDRVAPKRPTFEHLSTG